MSKVKVGKVEALWRYPVSSVGGQRLERMQLAQSGPVGDRLFGIFDDETHDILFPARQKHANLAPLIAARLADDKELFMSLDGKDWYAPDDPEFRKALAELFGRPVSVVRYGTDLSGKPTTTRYKHSPIHLLSLQSMEALKRLLPGSAIDERRFRPNILVDYTGMSSTEVPEYELLGQEFQIGGLRLRGTRPCGRCAFTSMEQLGVPEDRGVLRTLLSDFERNFGIYCEIIDPGFVEVGDDILAEAKSELDASVVIVGAGQAGGSAAIALRELGHKGPITIFGEERHTPYERPPLSKPLKVPGTANALTSVLSGVQAGQLGIDMHLDETVVRVDRENDTIETAHGGKYKYDRLILATGGAPRRLPKLSRGYGRIHSIRTSSDAVALHASLQSAKRIFVLGAGWLGLEVAAMARAVSIEVDVFDREANLCSRALPKVVGDYLAGVHTGHGVKLHMQSEPVFVEWPDAIEVSLDGRTEYADLLVVAIGINPNDHLARLAGLECRGGILTNENGATADPNVFAIGDVSSQRGPYSPEGMRIESWQNANDQAQRAARAILGLKQTPSSVPRFWSDQYDLTIQIAGMPDPTAAPIGVDGVENPLWTFKNFVVGVNRPREVHQFAQAASVRTPDIATQNVEPAAQEATTRHELGDKALFGDNDLQQVSIEPVGKLALVRKGEEYFAIQDRCPHAEASLSEGFIEGGHIVCPLHFAEFDLVSGAASNGPKGCTNARTYKVEAEGNLLYIYLPAGK